MFKALRLAGLAVALLSLGACYYYPPPPAAYAAPGYAAPGPYYGDPYAAAPGYYPYFYPPVYGGLSFGFGDGGFRHHWQR